MKQKRQFLIILVALIVVAGVGIFFTQAVAQNRDGGGAVKYLEEQFRKQSIPVVGIKVLQEFPLQLEFVIQSASDGEKGTPEDPINFHMVQREAILARREGYFVTNIIRIFINKNGDQIDRSEVNMDPDEYTSLDFQPAKLGDNSVKELVLNKITSLGLPRQDLSVSSMDGFQTLHAVHVVSSLDKANKIGLELPGRFSSILADLNQQGAQIVMTHIEIKDGNGNYYFNYMYDLQLDTESWWMADGFDDSWFPHP